jgi:uncharacterized surface protein with fasciclin (FAS1) repeats
MKINILNRRVVVLLFTPLIIFVSCVKNSTTTPPIQNPTVAQTIKSGTNLTLFNAALVRTGLDTVLNNPAVAATVFISTDQIMTTYGFSASVIDTMNIDTLKRILEYCMYLGTTPIQFSQFPVGINVNDTTSGGDSIFITKNGTAIFINGISVPTTDVRASNGFLDVMAQPLFPPKGTILQITQSDTTLSYFDSAVSLTASIPNNIQALLTNGNIYTVFVPNNAAFRNAGYASIDTFHLMNPNFLANFLSYHIVAGRYFTSDMSIALSNPLVTNDTATKATISTLTDSAIKVTLGISYQIEGAADSVAANLYAPNVMAHNGVIHKIDRVLLQ